MISIKQIVDAWNRFWFSPTSPSPVCLYRIFYGLLIIAYALICLPSATAFFGPHGLVPEKAVVAWEASPRLSLLLWMHAGDSTVITLFWLLIAAAIFLTVGLFSRVSSVVVWLLLVSFHQRDPFILNVGDHFLRIFGFLLMFAPSGRMYSIDAWLRPKQTAEASGQRPLCAPWAQRLMQLQIAAMYCQAFWVKMLGTTWWNGTAAYYATHVGAYAHLPVPFGTLLVYQFISYMTLVIEFSLWTLIWVKEFRYFVLLAAVCMHLGMELFMTLPMLFYVFTSGLILFVDPDDLERALRWLKNSLQRRQAEPKHA